MSLLTDVYAEGTLEYWLCPREALESQSAAHPESAGEQLTILREAVADADGDAREVCRRLRVNFSDPLEGVDWWAWFQWLDARLLEVAADPGAVYADVEQPVYYPWRLRGSRFTGTAAKRQAADVVVAASAEVVDAWLSAAGSGPARLRLVGDMAAEVGEIAELSWRPYDRFSAAVSSAVPSRVVGVVLRRDRSSTGFGVLGVDVVDPHHEATARETRARFPLVHALLGGWFGDDELRDRHPWNAQRSMLATEDDAVLAAFAGQLRKLLADSDDEELELAVEALGCFVQPTHLRLWLTWMTWRIETFDWKTAVWSPGATDRGSR